VVYVGTSGWQYADWRPAFYPPRLPQQDWLDHYATHFRTVELNSSFYHLPSVASFQRWRDRTPPDFVMAVKMSRFVTHLRRLREASESILRFVERAAHLGPKLGPVLLQLPPGMGADGGRLAAALDAFPAGVRVAVEFRDDSWFEAGIHTILERHGAAMCLADSPGRTTPPWRTASWGFVRFHWGSGDPEPCYEEDILGAWAERIASLWPAAADVYCYFNNDPRCCAVRDAARFARVLRRVGLEPSRTPPPEVVEIAG
jgi:uncharacterized protein YecE (DUF72 family)